MNMVQIIVMIVAGIVAFVAMNKQKQGAARVSRGHHLCYHRYCGGSMEHGEQPERLRRQKAGS